MPLGLGFFATAGASKPLTVDYLVIAGGAGGGDGSFRAGGGGGAGGYRTSAGTSGGGAAAESALTVALATNSNDFSGILRLPA